MNASEEKVRVNILLPKELFDKIEERSKKSFLGRTPWIIQAINEKISKEDQDKMKDLTES